MFVTQLISTHTFSELGNALLEMHVPRDKTNVKHIFESKKE